MRQQQVRRIPRAVALRPRMISALPLVRARIQEIQAELLEELRLVDAAVQDLVVRRHEVVAELRKCRDGLGHAGTHWKRVPLPGEVDAEPVGTVEISGSDLRQAVAAMVSAADRPVNISQIHRMLLAHGYRPAGRSSKTISDALRHEVVAGRIVRLDRGVYAGRRGGH